MLTMIEEDTVSGKRFIAKEISFRNTTGPTNQQAVALKSDSDFSVFYRCEISGYQVFQNCTILVKKGLPVQKNTITAQGGIYQRRPIGFSFQFCNIFADSDLLPTIKSTSTFLGRPWHICIFKKYNNFGPGADLRNRVKWSGGCHVLNDSTQTRIFTLAQFILGINGYLRQAYRLSVDFRGSKQYIGEISIRSKSFPLSTILSRVAPPPPGDPSTYPSNPFYVHPSDGPSSVKVTSTTRKPYFLGQHSWRILAPNILLGAKSLQEAINSEKKPLDGFENFEMGMVGGPGPPRSQSAKFKADMLIGGSRPPRSIPCERLFVGLGSPRSHWPLLDGANYHSWARSMRRALGSKLKFEFLDGSILMPLDAFDPPFRAWNRCNMLTHSWLINFVESSIARSIVFMDNASNVWLDLKERFS
ncbi:hypothetical protein TSUD_63900 [Trifolium subterraneum]|uniref:Uncharacterized protein n=1 Tax=Trifolium subterraneum TaxID=3900 RepID=A0A2Z6P5X6_TRISU|nr:hypothetical protein TSUD_63900 [Trifolium subterraneum]